MGFSVSNIDSRNLWTSASVCNYYNMDSRNFLPACVIIIMIGVNPWNDRTSYRFKWKKIFSWGLHLICISNTFISNPTLKMTKILAPYKYQLYRSPMSAIFSGIFCFFFCKCMKWSGVKHDSFFFTSYPEIFSKWIFVLRLFWDQKFLAWVAIILSKSRLSRRSNWFTLFLARL